MSTGEPNKAIFAPGIKPVKGRIFALRPVTAFPLGDLRSMPAELSTTLPRPSVGAPAREHPVETGSTAGVLEAAWEPIDASNLGSRSQT